MVKITQLRSVLGKEVTRLQLIRTFIERRIQPFVASAHYMWDYTGRQNPTRFTFDELKEVEIDERVCAVTSLMKKIDVPKIFGMEAFSKSHPRTEVHALSFRLVFDQNFFSACLVFESEFINYSKKFLA
jgi:hypothetical protein